MSGLMLYQAFGKRFSFNKYLNWGVRGLLERAARAAAAFGLAAASLRAEAAFNLAAASLRAAAALDLAAASLRAAAALDLAAATLRAAAAAALPGLRLLFWDFVAMIYLLLNF
ncbi:hypothetical protein LBMAG37_02840 [Anaerolineae bacterium]|nr:hypothetical protein LBMAG37_02840 [Anaerolineae bacterium]